MHFLLVLLVVGSQSESLTTEPFSDLKSCMKAGVAIKEWVEDNDARMGSPVRFKCIQVNGR